MDKHDEVDLLELALDATRDLILIKGPESRLLWANQAFLDYYGMTRSELRDLVDGPQSDPDDTLQYVRDDAMVFEIGDHVDVPAEMVTDHRGRSRLFHTVKSPIVIDGDVAMSVGVSRRHEDADVNVSSSHLDAKALSKPLRLLTNALQLAAAVVDVRGRLAATSRAWDATFGRPSDGAEAFLVDAHPALASLAAELTAALEAGTSSARQISLGDGSTRCRYDVRVGPWHYDDGTLGGALILGLDVTEQMAQAERLQDANDRFDLVLAGASVGIWDWLDVNGDEEYWSSRFYELLGFEPGEIEASLTNFADLLHPDDAERTFALVDEHFESGTAFDLEYRLRTRSGEYRWFRGTGIAARDDHGAPGRMVGSIQDIDARVRAQLATQRMNEDLEHFAHVASHDLREPARRQRMLIDFFLEDYDDRLTPEQRRDLAAIKDQSTHMLDMISGFRVLTSLSGPALELEDLDVQAMARTVVDEVLSDDDARAASIDLPRTIKGYPQLVTILLRNLILNARDHGSSPLSLVLDTHAEAPETIIAVENAWTGDPSDVTDQYFNPFVAGRQRDTTGLGLSICRRVVEHHRGWITAKPRTGTFRVEFNLGSQ